MSTLSAIYAGVKTWYKKNLVANPNFTLSVNDLNGLIKKISKMWHIAHVFDDKLGIFERGTLPYGNTIEEWSSQIVKQTGFDPTGATALSPHYIAYNRPSYSSRQDRQVFTATRPMGQLEDSVLTADGMTEMADDIIAEENNGYIVYKYAIKRELLGHAVDAADTAMGTATTYTATTAYNLGDYVKSGGNVYVVTKKKDTTNIALNDAIAQGYLVQLHLTETVAMPTDTASGDDFIVALKKQIEIASDASEGNSFNGTAIGPRDGSGLVLIVKQGVMPVLEVHTQAGAFHLDKVAIPTRVIVVPNFGSSTSKAYAILADDRMFASFVNYDAYRTQENGQGDFFNYFHHVQHTLAYSYNTYFHVFEDQ